MRVLILYLLAGVMLCFLELLLSLRATTSEVPGVPSVLAGANVGHVHRGAANNAPTPVPDGIYSLTPAEEVQETDKLPANASLLTILVLAIVALGASVLRLLMTHARRRGAICSWGVDLRSWLAGAHEGASFLGVFRL